MTNSQFTDNGNLSVEFELLLDRSCNNCERNIRRALWDRPAVDAEMVFDAVWTIMGEAGMVLLRNVIGVLRDRGAFWSR